MPRSYSYDIEGGEGRGHNPDQEGLLGGRGGILAGVFGGGRREEGGGRRDKEEERPCRTCTDFRTWIKLGGKGLSKVESVKKKEGGGKFVPSEEQLEEMDRASKECPVDKDELGSATWKLLHTLSVNYPDRPTVDEKEEMAQFLRLFSRLYPCPPCAEDFRQDLRSHPPQLDSSSSFARWLCGAHNRVNAKLDKPQFDCDRVFERWRDGWQDGRCDEL